MAPFGIDELQHGTRTTTTTRTWYFYTADDSGLNSTIATTVLPATSAPPTPSASGWAVIMGVILTFMGIALCVGIIQVIRRAVEAGGLARDSYRNRRKSVPGDQSRNEPAPGYSGIRMFGVNSTGSAVTRAAVPNNTNDELWESTGLRHWPPAPPAETRLGRVNRPDIVLPAAYIDVGQSTTAHSNNLRRETRGAMSNGGRKDTASLPPSYESAVGLVT